MLKRIVAAYHEMYGIGPDTIVVMTPHRYGVVYREEDKFGSYSRNIPLDRFLELFVPEDPIGIVPLFPQDEKEVRELSLTKTLFVYPINSLDRRLAMGVVREG